MISKNPERNDFQNGTVDRPILAHMFHSETDLGWETVRRDINHLHLVALDYRMLDNCLTTFRRLFLSEL